MLKWRTIHTPHFSIHYYEGEEAVAQKLAPIGEEVFEILSKKFDIPSPAKTEVLVLNNKDVADEKTTTIPYNMIVIQTASPAVDNFFGDYDSWLKMLFVHEYTHILHLTDTRKPATILKPILGSLDNPNRLTPDWVTEGLAAYFETVQTKRGIGRSSLADMILRTAILHDQFLALNQVSVKRLGQSGWMIPTIYGVGFWQYLADTYGEEKLLEFSHQVGRSLWFYSFNAQAKKVFISAEGRGKKLSELWEDWKESLQKKYWAAKATMETAGLREGELFLQPKAGESFSLPTLSPDGKTLVYLASSIHHPFELRVRDLERAQEKILLKKEEVQQISFSPDGEKILVSLIIPYWGFYKFSDLLEISLTDGSIKRWTKGERAKDPDYAPDGAREIGVLQKTSTATLAIYQPLLGSWEPIYEGEQLSQPRWLPDNRRVVFAEHRNQWDLWLIDTKTKKRTSITRDIALETHPVVDIKNHAIYFSSDKSGVSNIYRYDILSGKTSQITHVLTGAFAPSLSSDGTLIYQYYNGEGFELRKVGTTAIWRPTHFVKKKERYLKPEESLLYPTTRYNAFPKIVIPHLLVPNVGLLDGGLAASLYTLNFDPVFHHVWRGSMTYRNDSPFFGLDFKYTYNGLLLPLSAEFARYLVNYGDIFNLKTNYFEKRNRFSVGGETPPFTHQMSLNYFFENSGVQAGLPRGSTLATLGRYAGLHAKYSFRNTEGTEAQISPESGTSLTLQYEISRPLFGASRFLNQQVVWGDARAYLPIPIAPHHVLALRAAGGDSFGNLLIQGNFSLGGSVGESLLTSVSSRLFTLRGLPLVTFSRDRVWISSAEYRIPLVQPRVGLGTLPLGVQNAHLAFFADTGDAFDPGEPKFRPFVGVGGEVRAEFLIGYHLPLLARLGYGIILTHRDRLSGIKDGLTSVDVRNGVMILDLGSSF